MAKITYEDKVQLNNYPDIAEKNKVTANNINEIKQIVNQNDDNTTQNKNNIGTLSSLTTTTKSSLVGAINEINNKPNNVFSEDEVQIGTWLGKPLYRKVVYTTGLTSKTKKTIKLDIASIETLWLENGFINNENGNRICTIPMVGYNGSFDADKLDIWFEGVGQDDTRPYDPTIYLYSSGGWGNSWVFYIIINYTKWTD